MAVTITPHPTGGAEPSARPDAGTDPVAITALVLAFVLPLVGLVLGIVALVRTRFRPGRGLAVAATVVSVVGSVVGPLLLASIAIPVFLNQRDKGWEAAQQAALRAAATEIEVGLVEGSAPGTPGEVLPSSSADVQVVLVASDGFSYCLAAQHELRDQTLYLDSAAGVTGPVPCG